MQWSTPQPKYLATPAHHGGHHHHSHSSGSHSSGSGNTNTNTNGSGNRHHGSSGGNNTNTNNTNNTHHGNSYHKQPYASNQNYAHHRAPSPQGATGYSAYLNSNEGATTPTNYSPRGGGGGGGLPGSARRSASKPKEYETDPHRLAQRQKQIMYGENTPGYANFIKALERDPTLAQGCVPAKPSIVQKCSKRSWDGQVRKWRRALHMYDFVDFGTDAEESKRVQLALVQQTRNPDFRHRNPNGDEDAAPREVLANEYVRYTFDDMMALGESALISQSIRLPESINWLDKRVDLEDDIEDDDEFFINTAAISSPIAGMKSSPSASPSPSRYSPMRPGSPLSSSPARCSTSSSSSSVAAAPPASPVVASQQQQQQQQPVTQRLMVHQHPNNPSISPPAATGLPLTPSKTPSPPYAAHSLSPLMARTTYALPTATVPVSVQLPNGQTAIALMQMQQVQQMQQAVGVGGATMAAPAALFFAPADPHHHHHQQQQQQQAGVAPQAFCWSPPPAADTRQLFAQPPTPQQQQHHYQK